MTLLVSSVFSVVVATAALAQGKIAFSSTRSGTPAADIYVMNPDGSAQTRLTSQGSAPASSVDPTWSPDRSKLAFTRIGFTSKKVDVGHIWVMDADGTGQVQLTSGPKADSYPAWSPDGTQIAFTRGHVDNAENSEVFVMNADGSHVRRLTHTRGFNGFPSWSSDGTKIAFTSDRDGNPEIYTMNADGSGQTRLTKNPADDAHPAWSPNGQRIAFISDRDGSFQLYVMPAGGGPEQRLTSGLDEDNIPVGEYAPTWSPDGATIVYSGDDDPSFEIVDIAAGGGPMTKLPNPAAGFAPDWQPGSATASAGSGIASAGAAAVLGVPMLHRPGPVGSQGVALASAFREAVDVFQGVFSGGSQGTSRVERIW